MQNKQSLKVLLLFFLFSLDLFAIDGKCRVYIKSNDTIYTSQKVTVAVELLSNAFSITDAKIIFPPSNKYIVQAPQSASYLGQEEIENEDWQMVHYEYEVYALQSGKIEIPSLSVSFTASMGYGQPKKEFGLQSNPISFDVVTPKGLKEDQFVLVTDHFIVNTVVKPEKSVLTVGDAIELTVTQKANGILDVLLSPVEYRSNTFIRTYRKEPELKSGLKGKYDVSRTDSFTLIASVEGNVTLPAQERVWYNSSTEEIHVEKIPAIQYEILPDPQIAIDAKKARQKELFIYVGSVLLILVGLYAFLAPKIRHYRTERMRKFEESETGKFSALLSTVESGDVVSIDRQYYRWLLSIAPQLVRGGMEAIETIQPSFTDVLKEFDMAMVEPDRDFDRIRFSSELNIFREKLLHENKSVKEGLPVAINPA